MITITFNIGIDTIAFCFLLLTAFIFPLCFISNIAITDKGIFYSLVI